MFLHINKNYTPCPASCLFRSQYQRQNWLVVLLKRRNYRLRVDDHVTDYGECQRGTGGRGLSEEESGGQCRGRCQFTPIVILYSPLCLTLRRYFLSHSRRPPRPPNPLSADPPTSTLVLLLLHAVQHRYALIYEPSRPLKTSGHFPAKRKIVHSGQ